MRRFAVAILFVTIFASRIFAQEGNASLTGFVQDPSKAFLPGVSVLAINTNTNQQFPTTTNKDGSYSIASLPVGPYRMQIEKAGFQTILKEGIFLHTQDVLQINYQMAVGSSSESVTVTGGTPNINTTDATVGMIVDRNFVDNIPMNGRSFQSLVLLSPGVVSESPQGTDTEGEYSVNGQRTTSNNFTVDGVSAMGSASTTTGGASTTASTSNHDTLGTTHAIISIDAMQEFRIATSTYTAEYGRTPGAQIDFISRSGTNSYHGSAFDYLRNYAFDANNWFNNYSTPVTPRSQERQNDFGGTFGGPVSIPGLFSGKDRAFYFFNYEGIRLQQPLAATISYVPSNGTHNTATYANAEYKNLRANAPAVLQPGLDGFPLPNCDTSINAQCIDFGDGLSPALLSGILPSSLNNFSLRLDYRPYEWLRTFARVSQTTSSAEDLDVVFIQNKTQRTRSFVLGADSTIGGNMANEFRAEYAPSNILIVSTGKSIDGSSSISGQQTPNLWSLQGLPDGGATRIAVEDFPGGEAASSLYAQHYGTQQYDTNYLDTLTWSHGTHLFKAGVNYRAALAYTGNGALSFSPNVYYIYESAAQVLSNVTDEVTTNRWLRQDPVARSLGTFAQDQWRLTPRVSLSLGVRWDFNPPPSVGGAQQYTYTGNINEPSTMALSAKGAPLYKTTWTDFSPRLGTAIVLHNVPGRETVLRAGGGLFYDSGQSSFTNVIGHGYGLGVGVQQTIKKASFPVPLSVSLAPIPTTVAPPYTMADIIAPNFVPPSTIEASVSLEQEIDAEQSVTFGFVTAEGRNLSELMEYSLSKLNPLFTEIEQYQNGPGSNYNSGQVLYKRQMSHGLQAIASYTWAHAIDSISQDSSPLGLLPPQRGNSDHDVRHSFNTALIYNVRSTYASRIERAILGYWSGDLRYFARTAFPVSPVGPSVIDSATGLEYDTRLDYNGQNPYVHIKGIPGGRQFNPADFSVPGTDQTPTAPRNFLRAFGANAVDTSIERTFPVTEQVHLLFRAEAFNLLNHPNFGALNLTCGSSTAGATCTNPLFGQATNTLSTALGSGDGLGALYQQGGPRSMQFALKLQF